ncbi:MAG: sulfatase [bacterium]|nr:sulfatase [bacterium]
MDTERDRGTQQGAMSRRAFLKAGLLAGGAAVAAGAIPTGMAAEADRPAGAPDTRRPNLVFVFSDQHSHDMLGCYGNDQIITPNLDRFAAEGVRFTQCVSQYPICTPFRSMLLSGQHILYNACLTNDIQMLPGHGKYFAEVLHDAGYHTGYVGKWHLFGGDRNRPVPPGPCRYGFDETFLTNNCTMDFRPGHAYYWNEKGEKTVFEEWEPYGQTRQALEFLEQCREDQPFALFVSWHPPHDHFVDGKAIGYTAPPELMARYDRDKIRMRPNTDEELYKEYSKYRPAAKNYKGQSDDNRDDYHGYYAMCTGVDTAFGRIVDKLKQKELDRNTIVVFTSDHGCSLGAWTADIKDVARRENISLSQAMPKILAVTKGTPHDWSMRTPLLVRWPGRLKPRVSDLPFGTLDFMPTLLGMMGLPIPDTCQGANLTEYIRGGKDDAVASLPIFSTWYRGVYTPRHTYTISKPGTGWLYDREKDPWQTCNVFDSADYAEVRKRLHRETLTHMARFRDRFPSSSTLMARTMGAGSEDARGVHHLINTSGIPKGRPIDLVESAPSVLPELNGKP